MVSCGKVMARHVGMIVITSLAREAPWCHSNTASSLTLECHYFHEVFLPQLLFLLLFHPGQWLVNSNFKLGSSVPCHVAVIFRRTVMLCCFLWSLASSTGPLYVKMSKPNGKFFPSDIQAALYELCWQVVQGNLKLDLVTNVLGDIMVGPVFVLLLLINIWPRWTFTVGAFTFYFNKVFQKV